MKKYYYLKLINILKEENVLIPLEWYKRRVHIFNDE